MEFNPDSATSVGNFLDLKQALERLLQRPVDLLEPHTIRNHRLRHHIHHGKAPVYGTA